MKKLTYALKQIFGLSEVKRMGERINTSGESPITGAPEHTPEHQNTLCAVTTPGTKPAHSIYPKEHEGCSLLSKCCFCIPLKTGCFILGYISMALNFLITLFFIGTFSFLALYTHGFRYIRLKENENGQMVPDPESIDKSRLSETVSILVLVGFLNIAWLLMNIVLLIGLHRKRPGHIKLHVSVATIRLVLSIIGLVMYGPHHTSHSMVISSGEIALTAYFILVYYLYAVQLEQKLRPHEPREVSDIVAAVLFSYPQNIDKINLTEKNDNSVTPPKTTL